MWTTILVFGFALVHADVERGSTESKNEVVSTRLIALSLDNCKKHVGFLKRMHLYRDLKSDEFTVASPSIVREIDLGLGEYLARVANSEPDAGKLKNYTEGIQRIRKIRHLYGGQFIGVSRKDGQEFVICCYSVVEDIDEFHGLKHVPYSHDGDGANFFFQYNPASKVFSKFSISGGFGGPFGQ